VTSRTQRRSLLVALALAAVLLYFAFRGVDWTKLIAALARARPEYLAIAVGVFSFSTFLRSLRWRVLLGAEKWLPPATVFWGTAVGYLGNGFLPARAGELLRSAMISRASGLGVGYVLATALTERLLDAVALVAIVVGVLATLDQVADWLVLTARAGAVAAVLGIVLLLVAPFFEGTVLAIVARLPISERLRDLIGNLASRFLLGLRAVRSPSRAALFYGLTAVIWLSDAIAFTLCARALDLVMGLRTALLTLSALGLSSAAPSTPGFIGIYQFVARTILPPFGFSDEEALAFILALQGCIYLTIIPWGALGLWRLSVAAERET
jgi:uncharacterized protein (TIRG00374 family)